MSGTARSDSNRGRELRIRPFKKGHPTRKTHFFNKNHRWSPPHFYCLIRGRKKRTFVALKSRFPSLCLSGGQSRTRKSRRRKTREGEICIKCGYSPRGCSLSLDYRPAGLTSGQALRRRATTTSAAEQPSGSSPKARHPGWRPPGGLLRKRKIKDQVIWKQKKGAFLKKTDKKVPI